MQRGAIGTGLHRRRLLAGAAALATAVGRGRLADAELPTPPPNLPRYQPPAPPALTARAAFAADVSAGTPLFALAASDPRPPASLTKLATALVVIDNAALDERVTIDESDLVGETESQVGLRAGDVLAVGDLLVGLLVPSGNDAARSLARHVGGSLDPAASSAEARRAAFIAEMNRDAARRGLADTNWANPSGLDDEGHYSSARDLATLAAAAVANPTLREALGTQGTTLPSTIRPDGYPIVTTNDLLVEGLVTAGKTGTTEGAGGCLMTATTIDGNDVVTVVLGSRLDPDDGTGPRSRARFDDTRRLLADAEARYVWLDPLADEPFAELNQELAVWRAALPSGARVVAPADGLGSLRHRLMLGESAAPGSEVGRVLFFVGRDLLSERAVVQAV